jgi:hypothetical protein
MGSCGRHPPSHHTTKKLLKLHSAPLHCQGGFGFCSVLRYNRYMQGRTFPTSARRPTIYGPGYHVLFSPGPRSFYSEMIRSLLSLWYDVFAGDGLRSNGVDDLPPSKSVCFILPIARHLRGGTQRYTHPARVGSTALAGFANPFRGITCRYLLVTGRERNGGGEQSNPPLFAFSHYTRQQKSPREIGGLTLRL